MELWFVFAVLSALIGGFGAFGNKIVAERKYDTQFVLILIAISSLAMFLPLAFWFERDTHLSWTLIGVTLLAGIVMSVVDTIRIQSLHYIDSAIFLPIYKVVGPLLVIIIGLVFFGESFSALEWMGLIVSLLVPILLISRAENTRQNNLKIGLILIAVCAVISSVLAGLQKLATDIQNAPLWIVCLVFVGMLFGAAVQYWFQNRGSIIQSFQQHYSHGMFLPVVLRSLFAEGGFYLLILALTYGGPLGIVYTISSLYIIPSIVLAIIFYNEHWNFRKTMAIVLSVVALGLLR